MSDSAWAGAILFSAILAGGCLTFLGMAFWKMVSCLRDVTGSRFREDDRQRQDLHHLIERLLEKRDVPTGSSVELDALHAQERMNTVHHTADTEKRAQEVERKGTNRREPLVSVNTDETAYQHQ